MAIYVTRWFDREEKALKKLAGYLLALTPEALDLAQQSGELREVPCDAQDKVSYS